MRVRWFRKTEDLAELAGPWNLLARNPFCTWDWLEAWWRHYGALPSRCAGFSQLFVLGVFDDAGVLAGVAPWYRQWSLTQGCVVRCLGSGEVLSDYLTVPCRNGLEDRVARVLADWLTSQQADANSGPEVCTSWDLLELSSVEPRDYLISCLARYLGTRRCNVQRQLDGNCWRIELPGDWNEYLEMLSKSHRKQLRRIERRWFDTGRAVLRTVEQPQDLERAWGILTDLHQRRARSLGRPGGFSARAYAAFHREAADRMLRAGQLQLHWLELDGQPVAVDYHLAQDGVIYVYQGGIDPDALDWEPGRMITLATLRRAIEQGYRAMDFLRGDEPYKAHWRAAPYPSLQVRIVPIRPVAQLRSGLRAAAHTSRQWIKRGLQSIGQQRLLSLFRLCPRLSVPRGS